MKEYKNVAARPKRSLATNRAFPCPHCGAIGEREVVYTRMHKMRSGGSIHRRYVHCRACDTNYSTYEMDSIVMEGFKSPRRERRKLINKIIGALHRFDRSLLLDAIYDRSVVDDTSKVGSSREPEQ